MSPMIGVVMLMGLVTKNGILLVDKASELRKGGQPIREAVLEAGKVRLRAILMTSLAMIFGMIPTALSRSESSEFRSPMAIAIIGGLITSTLLTLVVIPVVYTYIDRLTLRRRVAEEEPAGARAPESAPVPPMPALEPGRAVKGAVPGLSRPRSAEE
jgi:HAE1 family hydrophobic/amphiphilic exporter-1